MSKIGNIWVHNEHLINIRKDVEPNLSLSLSHSQFFYLEKSGKFRRAYCEIVFIKFEAIR